jgi:hypothetical protein
MPFGLFGLGIDTSDVDTRLGSPHSQAAVVSVIVISRPASTHLQQISFVGHSNVFCLDQWHQRLATTSLQLLFSNRGNCEDAESQQAQTISALLERNKMHRIYIKKKIYLVAALYYHLS